MVQVDHTVEDAKGEDKGEIPTAGAYEILQSVKSLKHTLTRYLARCRTTAAIILCQADLHVQWSALS